MKSGEKKNEQEYKDKRTSLTLWKHILGVRVNTISEVWHVKMTYRYGKLYGNQNKYGRRKSKTGVPRPATTNMT